MMLPSSNNNNGYKQPKTSFFGNYYNDTSHSQDHYYAPSSFSSFYLPSPNCIPLEDEAVFCDSFQHQQFFSNDHNHHDTVILAHDQMTKNVESIMGECGSNNGQVARNDHGDDHELPYDFINTQSPRKRHSKGDRHSKIDTARGPRDRRMRLSLDVAKKLFGLQDLLGFDKASKTVDWLITKSRTAILELLPDHQSCSFMGVSNTNSASSTSECEVLSGTVDESMLKTGDDQETTKNKDKSTSGSSSKKRKEKITRGVRKSADFHNPLAKATRERARAKARERTIEKRNHKLSSTVDQDSKCRRPFLDQAMDQDVNQLGSWSLFEENQCQSVSQHDQMSSQFQFKQGFVGDNSPMMMTAANLSPSSYLFNYQQIAGITHEHHLNEFQGIGKSWEGNNT